jgi:hypothetical protein
MQDQSRLCLDPGRPTIAAQRPRPDITLFTVE